MNEQGEFFRSPHSTNTTALICKTVFLEIPHAKSGNNKVSNGVSVRIGERPNCL